MEPVAELDRVSPLGACNAHRLHDLPHKALLDGGFGRELSARASSQISHASLVALYTAEGKYELHTGVVRKLRSLASASSEKTAESGEGVRKLEPERGPGDCLTAGRLALCRRQIPGNPAIAVVVPPARSTPTPTLERFRREIAARSADDGRQRRCGPRQAHCMVQVMRRLGLPRPSGGSARYSAATSVLDWRERFV